MTEFTPISGLIGGVLIGLASVLLMLTTGRIAGISGIFSGVLIVNRGDVGWRLVFVAGLIIGGLVWPLLSGNALPVNLQVNWPLMVVAGLLVGFGARLGGGCTSGHGICGIGRLSPRSVVATVVFITTAAITTFIMRHVIGG